MTVNPIPRPPKLEIFVDGSNFNLALDRDEFGRTVDLNLLATRLSRAYHFAFERRVGWNGAARVLTSIRSRPPRGQGGSCLMSTATMDVSIDQLRALPLEKRLEIIEALWDSVESEQGPIPISDDILDEADREFEAHLADPSSSIPWETARAKLRERYG
jgi:putative addiction module component (TIGR02574 family)